LRLSFGEEKTGGRNKRAILADIFESLTAAVYLDGGLEAAQAFVISRFRPLLDKIAERELELRDYKSALQEQLHSAGLTEPSYRVVEETGPDHCKRFVVEVVSRGKPLAQGEGLSKKEAEQHAAQAALEASGFRLQASGSNQIPESGSGS
jgi:ribonuclease-3